METVEPSNDRRLESWTNCPKFTEHVKKVGASDEFKDVEKKAKPFFDLAKDYVFGRQLSLSNIVRVLFLAHLRLLTPSTVECTQPSFNLRLS